MIENSNIKYEDALTVKERIGLYKKHNIFNYDYSQFQNWINTNGVMTEKDIYEMLDVNGISSVDFNLGLKALDAEERFKISDDVKNMKWVIDYENLVDNWIQKYTEEKLIEIEGLDEKLDLSISLSPFVLYVKESLQNKMDDLKNIKVQERITLQMIEKCSSILLSLFIKTLVWELHSDGFEDVKNGELSNKKFIDFIKRNFFSTNDLIRFYSKYPVVIRRLTTKCVQLTSHFLELLTRLDRDFFEVCDALDIDNSDNEITSISCDEGDTHQQGRFVVKVFLKKAKLVYKPRNLYIEKKFHALIDFINKNSNLLNMYVGKAFYREDYTFEKYVSYEGCSSEDEIVHYYQRFGQLCAIIYALSGNDIHYENIIAHSEYPVIVDIETLFQQLTSLWELPSSAFYVGYRECLDSIAGTALIPIIFFEKEINGKGVDISALNGDEQSLPFKVMVIKNANTDQMRFEYDDVKISSANNIPMLNNEKVNFVKYISHIVDSFEDGMNYIYHNKDLFVGDGGILTIFKGISTRQLLKSTQNYARLMEFSSHPNYSENMLKLERMFQNAWNYNYRDKRAVEHEVSDMIFGDIPIFYAFADSCDLIASDGTIVSNYFEESGYDRASLRIEKLSTRDIEKQIAQIKISFGLYKQECDEKFTLHSSDFLHSECNFAAEDKELLLAKTEQIARTILDTMIIDAKSETVNWNNVLFDYVNNCWKIRPLDQGLSVSMSGVFMFFAMLNSVKTRPAYESAIHKILYSLDSMPPVNQGFGTHTGIMSYVYPLLVLSSSDNKNMYMDKIFHIVKSTEKNFDKILPLGFIDGYAGLVKLMLEIYKVTNDQYYLNIADRAIEKIKSEIQLSKANLDISFGHGLSGIYYSLNQYMLLTNNNIHEDLNTAILKIIKQEIEHLDDYSWEWGISGVLLAIAEDIEEKQCCQFLTRIVDSLSLEDGLATGKCGQIKVLSKFLSPTDIISNGKTVNDIIAEMIDRNKRTNEFNIYSSEGFPSVGLFYGLSGIGYEFLTLYCGRELPDLLTLSL